MQIPKYRCIESLDKNVHLSFGGFKLKDPTKQDIYM